MIVGRTGHDGLPCAWNTGAGLCLDGETGQGRQGEKSGQNYQKWNIPAAGPLLYATNYALGTPGNAASYKVYIILTTGNESGSNPVTITRPG